MHEQRKVQEGPVGIDETAGARISLSEFWQETITARAAREQDNRSQSPDCERSMFGSRNDQVALGILVNRDNSYPPFPV